ncbi:MAG: DUF4340 domain-containing protein [Candidatus Omnitrophota bacterium]|nr:DUF4340 domain-containing protein [Candidatus Omnitrophota bacterium]
MKLKKLLILSGIVFVLLLVVYIKNVAHKVQVAKSQREEQAIILIKDEPNIFSTKIVIYVGDNEKDKITLVKQNNGEWVVENKFGVKARKDVVDGILNSLKGLKGEVRGDSKSVFSDFQILDTQGAHLILKGAQDKTLTHLVISFKKPNFNQNFVRLSDGENIVLTDRNILSMLGLFDKRAKPNANYFSDYKVFSFDPNAVVRIELKPAKKRSLVLSKAGGSVNLWEFEPRSPRLKPDLSKIDEFLKNILGFQALDSLDPKLAKYGFDKPLMELKLSLLKDKKAEEIQVTIGSFIKDKNAYYARIMPKNQVLIIPDYLIKNINRDKSYFLKKKEKK